MAQMQPNYPLMTSSVNEIIIKPLIDKYGEENVVWPIVLIANDQIDSYLYEVNKECTINLETDNRPISQSGKLSYSTDYRDQNRILKPSSTKLNELISNEYESSYKAILKSEVFNSVDLDYVWKNNNGWKGLELTTMWMPFKDLNETERLIKMMHRRPSWQGSNGPHGIRTLIDASVDLNLDYWMACVNTKDRVSNNLKTDGNVYRFPLTHANVDRLLKGEAPLNSHFDTFDEFINWL